MSVIGIRVDSTGYMALTQQAMEPELCTPERDREG